MMKLKIALLAAIALPLQFANSAVVINEVYGGGGNAGAPFNQDFVELFNNGVAPVDIGGFTLQYASATGTFGANNIVTFAAGTMIQPGSFFLVASGAVGGVGAALPTPNASGSVAMGATAGKVQLIDISLAVVDLVGYGATANQFEGTGPAPAPSNTTSVSRTAGLDTNNNNVDFSVSNPPTPMAAIPEPATYMLFGVGLLACAQRFRRARSRK